MVKVLPTTQQHDLQDERDSLRRLKTTLHNLGSLTRFSLCLPSIHSGTETVFGWICPKKVGDLTKTSHSNDMYLRFHTKIVRWWACSSHQETWSRRWYDPSTYFNLSSILLLSSLYFICSNQTRMHGGHCCAREWNDCLRVSIACVCLLLFGHRFSTTWSIKHTVPFTNEGFCHENTNFPRTSCLNPV